MIRVLDSFDLGGCTYSLLVPSIGCVACDDDTFIALLCERWPHDGGLAQYVVAPHPCFTEWWPV